MTLAIALVPRARLTAEAWRADDFDFWAFDRHADELDARGEPLQFSASASLAPALAFEIAMRVQRLDRMRNEASAPQWFDTVLAAHRVLHDLAKPLLRADYDHALDTWRWVLKLAPSATAALQLAALLHDIERLASEADQRIEHLAADYAAFKAAHAREGAKRARVVLGLAQVPADITEAACELITHHERPTGEPALRLLNDADALSFFSFNSPGYYNYFGATQTARKVSYTLARMSRRARSWLGALRLIQPIRDLIGQA